MDDRICSHIEMVFKDAPKIKSILELKEEMLHNLQEKFDNLVQEGKTADSAYRIAISSIGDISLLIDELINKSCTLYDQKEIQQLNKKKIRRLISVILWSITITFYIGFSMLSGAWVVTLLIFIINIAIEAIVNIIFLINRGEK